MIEIAASLLTDEFVVRIYEYLTITRVKELLGWGTDMAAGQRDGYLCCLEDLFGLAPDDELDQAMDSNKTIFDVIEQIIRILTPSLDEYIRKSRGDRLNVDDWLEVVDMTRTQVRDYAIHHFAELGHGIRSM